MFALSFVVYVGLLILAASPAGGWLALAVAGIPAMFTGVYTMWLIVRGTD